MCATIFKHGVDFTIVQWIRATLEGRLVAATLSGFSKRVAVSSGCPQGGVLSPLLWCLIDDLITRLNGGGIYTHGYADDTCLPAVGKFPNTVSVLIQWTLHNVEMRCDEVALSVNTDVSGLVVFTRRRKFPGFFEPHFLGLICIALFPSIIAGEGGSPGFSADLEHGDVKVWKAYNLLGACRRAYGSTWDLRPKMVRWLHFSIIRPSITFASLVWWPGCQTASAKKRLSRVQKLACLGIRGAMRTIPTSATEARICLPH
jgi:hypothetical protein